MAKRAISYMLDGDTFVGRYRVSDHDHVPSVSVQFETMALAARLENRTEEVLAKALLGELVRAKVAAERQPDGFAA
ncbi:hypothetical protein P7D22_18570 [Lichenihabitans sp. Uapishka_5]|uniref:hypothetical protein n=1 Tax=Lichenihabitans sp. Uapishka_5 TaxID=3037302 RepID=UPI0029E7E596|nr:hypothetical protein [Lichenihabitans sp. Uapishka_5]MDX7953171.1 hypothetical protein [Lichenihabitans sp. Uapishka_5]